MSFWQNFQADPQIRRYYLTKIKLVQLIRQFFAERHFQELEAPLLNRALLPESYVDVFATQGRRREAHQFTTINYFLPTSPEAFSKKMLVAGVGNNFCISKSFRNSEPTSRSHQPEFTLLEWYQLRQTLPEMMDVTEQLLTYLHQHDPFPTSVSVPKNWERLTLRQAFIRWATIDLEKSWDHRQQRFSLTKLRQLLPKNFRDPGASTWEELLDHLLLTYVEPNLPPIEPVILYNYPNQSTPLAKPVPGETTSDLLWAGRFEVYWRGLELCDAYAEQTDYEALSRAFREQEQQLQKSDKTHYPTDADFLEAIKQGLPECCGNALGIDRLAMIHSETTELPDLT